jgi:hypothetical protein
LFSIGVETPVQSVGYVGANSRPDKPEMAKEEAFFTFQDLYNSCNAIVCILVFTLAIYAGLRRCTWIGLPCKMIASALQ